MFPVQQRTEIYVLLGTALVGSDYKSLFQDLKTVVKNQSPDAACISAIDE